MAFGKRLLKRLEVKMAFKDLVKQFCDGELIKEGFMQFEASKNELPKLDPDAPQNDATPMKMTSRGMEAKPGEHQTPRERAADMEKEEMASSGSSEQQPIMASMSVLRHMLGFIKEDEALGAFVGKVMSSMAELEAAMMGESVGEPETSKEEPSEPEETATKNVATSEVVTEPEVKTVPK